MAAQLALVALVLFFVDRQSMASMEAIERQWIADTQSELVALQQKRGTEALRREIVSRTSTSAGRGDQAVLLLIGPHGSPLAGNLAQWPPTIPAETDWQILSLFRTGAQQPSPVALATTPLPDGSRLLTGRVFDTAESLRDINRAGLISAFAIAIVMALLLSLLFSHLLSRRVSDSTEMIAAFRAGDYRARAPINGSGDAFDRQANALNAMFAQIETLLGELRTITDGLAHDLRSPITRMIVKIERAAIEQDDPDMLTTLEQVRREADTLLAIVSAALLISRTESGIGREQREPTDIALLLADIDEIYGPLVEDAGMTLAVAGDGLQPFALNRQLVVQAIGNLIENAVKHAQGASAITVSAVAREEGIAIIVADNGVGIPADQRDTALRRFGRLDPARSAPGSGLGLSLVEGVAKLHDGNIALEDNAPGLRVVMRLGE